MVTFKGKPMIPDPPPPTRGPGGALFWRHTHCCRNGCTGIIDYVYANWFLCRDCGRWLKAWW